MSDRIESGYTTLIVYGIYALCIYLLVNEYFRVTAGDSGIGKLYVEKCTTDSILNYPPNLPKHIKHCKTVYAEMTYMASAPAQKVRFDYFGPHSGVDCFVANTRNWDCTTSQLAPIDGSYYPFTREGEINLDGIWHVKQTSALEYWSHKFGSWFD